MIAFLNINGIKYFETKKYKMPNKNQITIFAHYDTDNIIDNFTYHKFIDTDNNFSNATLVYWDKLILKYNMPFLKCSVPKLEKAKCITDNNYETIITAVSDYPIELIKKNVSKTSKVS